EVEPKRAPSAPTPPAKSPKTSHQALLSPIGPTPGWPGESRSRAPAPAPHATPALPAARRRTAPSPERIRPGHRPSLPGTRSPGHAPGSSPSGRSASGADPDPLPPSPGPPASGATPGTPPGRLLSPGTGAARGARSTPASRRAADRA